MILIDRLSAVSLNIEMYFGNQCLGSGTGFIVKEKSNIFLITNYHILSGKRITNQEPVSRVAAIPDKIRVWHHRKGVLGSWISKDYDLFDNEQVNKWIEIKHRDKLVDVAALKIEESADIDLNYLDLTLAKTDLVVSPAEPISVIGFPYGKSSVGKFPIWKTGHVASDYDLDYEGNPVFLIDATTKSGMSGSPVFAYRKGMVQTSKGWNMGSIGVKFLGIYSGRISDGDKNDIPDIGLVWKPTIFESLFGNIAGVI